MFRWSEFRFLIPELRRERGVYLLGSSLIIVSAALNVTIPWLLGQAVTVFRSLPDNESGAVTVRNLALAMVGAALLSALASFYTRVLVIGASRRVEFRLRNQLFRHLESLDAGFFGSTHTGDLMSRFTSDVDGVRMAIGPGIMYTVRTFFTLVLAVAFMLSISVSLTFLSLIPLLFLTVVIRFLGPRVHRESMRTQERLAELSVHAQENFSNIKVVKAFVREASEKQRMERLSQGYFEQNMRLARLRSMTNALLFLFGDLVVLSLLGLGGWAILDGSLTLAQFASFQGCLFLLIWPMIALGWVMTIFQRGAASAERLKEVLHRVPAIDDRAAVADTEVAAGGVRFDGVTFAYGDGEPVLRDISFDLAAGQTLGIVGPTGCGKTSLLQLVPRFHEASAGSIEIDGAPIASIPLAVLRDAIGSVPQEAFLFSNSIENNIAFATENATTASIHQVAELVRVAGEVERFPHGYQQRVGERGITLSGGQKQRLALARALLKKPKILLLDDVLSAVDAETEKKILDGLEEWTRSLTTIIVTHRLSAVRHADEILVLDERGMIRQRGNHDTLVAASGYYADTYRRQTLEDELESL